MHLRYAYLWIPSSPTGADGNEALVEAVLRHAPRLKSAGGEAWWVDIGGMEAHPVLESLLGEMQRLGYRCWIGAAMIPVVAEVAAREESESIRIVRPGEEADFLRERPLTLLSPPRELLELCDSVGIRFCGQFADLEPHSIELRFGGGSLDYWRLAQADDRRPLFGRIREEVPHTAIDFPDFALSDSERLLPYVRRMTERLCDQMAARGEQAGEMTLRLLLEGGGTRELRLRPRRPTRQLGHWMQVARKALLAHPLGDRVNGLELTAAEVSAIAGRQTDLFDRSVESAEETEAAIAEIRERYNTGVRYAAQSAHPLPERAIEWSDKPLRKEVGSGAEPMHLHLALQCLETPERVEVSTDSRGLPAHWSRRGVQERILAASGPEHISGGHWDDAFARLLFRCLGESGRLYLLAHDPLQDRWCLAGWWD